MYFAHNKADFNQSNNKQNPTAADINGKRSSRSVKKAVMNDFNEKKMEVIRRSLDAS